MMARRMRLFMTASMAVAVSLVVACGQDYGGGSEESDGPSSSSAEPELPDPPAIEGEVVTEGEEHAIRFGMGVGEDAPQYLAASYFADVLEERTGGRVTVGLYPNAQLGDDVEMMEGLQTGSLDMTYPSSAAASNIVPELAVLEFPFQFPTLDSGAQVIEGDIGRELLERFDGSGIKALVLDEEGYRNVTTSGSPVREPSDVEGLSIRVQESQIHVDIWEALGSSPQTMAFGELFTALEQGTIDAQENPWSTIMSSSFYEVQESASETGHVYLASLILMSDQLWDSLSVEDQQIVQEAAESTQQYKREVSRAYNEWAIEELQERGVEITVLDEDERAAFADASADVREEWADRVGRELADEVEAAVAEHLDQD